MSRKPIVAANWKMHRTPPDALGVDSPFHPQENTDIAVFPCALDIAACVIAGLHTGVQAARAEASGAFTGDISMAMAKESGCTYALCGHSERRTQHAETDDAIALQYGSAVSVGLQPILCIGETQEQHANGETESVLSQQIASIPFTQTSIIAYEPVWAIGSGAAASPAAIAETLSWLRSLLPSTVRESVRLLYGGSVDEQNAADYMQQEEIDGILVGSASLDTRRFASILRACFGSGTL